MRLVLNDRANGVHRSEYTISLDLLISLMEVLHVDANSILGESSDHKDNSIDAKLQELPEPQRQYFTTMFLTMLANYPAAA